MCRKATLSNSERSFILIWNAPQEFNRFANQRFTLTLDDQKEMKVTVPTKNEFVRGE